MEIEIDSAKRAFVFRLAEDDGHLLVESDAMTQVRTAVVVGLDRFLHQGVQRRLAIFGCLTETHNKSLESPDGFINFRFEQVSCHNTLSSRDEDWVTLASLRFTAPRGTRTSTSQSTICTGGLSYHFRSGARLTRDRRYPRRTPLTSHRFSHQTMKFRHEPSWSLPRWPPQGRCSFPC